MKIVAFGASTSSQSINRQFATYAVSLLGDVESEVLDLNDYELPLFSEDKEKEIGKPALAQAFYSKFTDCDAIVISFAEHNGAYAAAYKNIFDWASRINQHVYQNKPMIVLSTSPGGRGGASVLKLVENTMPYFGGDVKGSFSLPSFYDNFDLSTQKVSNVELDSELKVVMQALVSH